jgi:MoaA/NifB/PqqE/SkfB family radical SAM enzyme
VSCSKSEPAAIVQTLLKVRDLIKGDSLDEAADIISGIDEKKLNGSQALEMFFELREVIEKESRLRDIYKEHPITTKKPRDTVPPYRVRFIWHITQNCNYRCSYCSSYEIVNQDNFRILRPDEWAGVWQRIYEMYGTCAVHVTGGEPSVYPGFFDVMEKVSGIHILEFDSNLSWDPKNLIDRIDPVRVERIGLSYQPESVDFGDFFPKVMEIREAGFIVIIQAVAYPAFLRELEPCAKLACKQNLPFMLAPFSGDYNGKKYPDSYTDGEKALIGKIRGEKPKIRRDVPDSPAAENNPPEKAEEDERRCRCGEMFASIGTNGDAVRCMVSRTPMGNIIKGNFRLDAGAMPCAIKDCDFNKRMVLGMEKKWLEKWPLYPRLGKIFSEYR